MMHAVKLPKRRGKTCPRAAMGTRLQGKSHFEFVGSSVASTVLQLWNKRENVGGKKTPLIWKNP